MTSTYRPTTSKARGICKYYTTDRGCFNSKNCKFLHSSEPIIDPTGSRPPTLTPYDQSKRCRYYDDGYCKHGDKCWFVHEKKIVTGVAADDDDDDELCSVCFEKPSLYGLLGGCNHIFCIDCIRKWRDPAGKGGDISNIKKCPMCRTRCRYIIPSSRFYKDGLDKERIVQKYKDSMARVPCRHFAATKAKNPKKPMCPFGKDCFYQHLNDNGTPYVFPRGAEISLQNWARRNSPRHRMFGFMPEGFDTSFFQTSEELAGSIAVNMFDHLMTEVLESNAGGRVGGGAGVGRGTTIEQLRVQRINDANRTTLNRAVAAIRTQIQGGASRGQEGEGARPIFVTGTPLNWDLEGDGDATDHGWGWNELVAEAVDNADADLTERLELLADHMLGSFRIFRSRDTESPPPLEPISNPRSDTPPPPLESIGGHEDEDGDVPALQSVSNSSDSEYDDARGDDDNVDSDDEPDRFSDYSEPDGLPPVQRAWREHLDRIFPNTRETADEDLPPPLEPIQNNEASSASIPVVEIHQEPGLAEGPIDTPETLGKESCGVEIAIPVAALPEDHEPSPSSPDLTHTEYIPPEPMPEPPFVTDGRGRVVWSNKDESETTPSPEPPSSSRQDAQLPSPGTSRLFEWMTGFL